MRSTLAAASLSALLSGLLVVQSASAQNGEDGRVRIGAFNLENAFDVFDDPYTNDESMEPKPREELKEAASAIKALDADVLGIVEVENEHVLRAMISEFLPDSGYEYVTVLPTNSDRGINLGVISRYPIVRTARHGYRQLTLPGDSRNWPFSRGMAQITLDVPGDEHLELFVVHLKSKRDSAGDPNSRSWRLAEATEAATIIGDLLGDKPEALVAMVGDFNDEPGAEPINTILAAGVKDPHDGLPADQRITYLREPYRSTIDYVLVSPALLTKLVPGTATVGLGDGGMTGSDHAPVAATFDLDD